MVNRALEVLLPLVDPDALQLGDRTSYAVDGLRPSVVLRPGDVESVAAVLKAAAEHELAVVPWGGGTQIGLGNPPRRLDAVLDLSRLDELVDHQPTDLTATVQAGITLGRLQAELEKGGQFLPLDPPLPDRATVGGTLAANSSGPRRLAYGTARDLLLGVRVAHPDGTLTRAGGRVVKNVTGYDLNKLYVGSLGTLGIIVEATVKLAPLPAAAGTLRAVFPSVAVAANVALEVLRRGLGPLALTLLDATAVSHVPELRLDVPPDQALLAVDVGGRKAAVERRMAEIGGLFREQGALHLEGLEKERGRSAVEAWRGLGDLGWGDGPGAPLLVTRCGVLPTQVADLGGALQGIGQRRPFAVGLVCQVGHGIVRGLWWPQQGVPAAEAVVALVRDVRQAAGRLGSHAILERCPVEVKRHLDVWGEVEEQAGRIMRRLKQSFDPKGVLSPGRFVGGI